MKEEVKDRYSVVWLIFVLLGASTLLPFNVFTTEFEFFSVRLSQPPYNTWLHEHFMSLFCLTFNTLNLITLGFLVRYQKSLSLRVLVLQPMLITLIMLVSTAALALRTDVPGDLMAKFTLPSMGLMGLCTAMLQGGTLQLASIFSPVHIRGVVSGIAIGGVITSSLSFVSQLRANDAGGGAATPEDVAPAAFMYFGASALVVGATILGYNLLPWLPYGRYKLLLAGIIDDPKERKLMTVDDDYEEPLLTVVEGDVSGPSSSIGGRVEHTRAAIICVESDYSQANRSWQHKHAFTIYCVALFFCLCVTMATHPGISSFMCSVKNPATVSPCTSRTSAGRLAGDLFVPMLYDLEPGGCHWSTASSLLAAGAMMSAVVFAIGDYLGRAMSGMGPWGHGAPKPLSILAYSLIRSGIAGCILICHVVTPSVWLLPNYLSTDYAPITVMLALGWTQGHLISTICMHAPSTLLPTETSRYGPVTSFAISVGCFVGSFVCLSLSSGFQSHSE